MGRGQIHAWWKAGGLLWVWRRRAVGGVRECLFWLLFFELLVVVVVVVVVVLLVVVW